MATQPFRYPLIAFAPQAIAAICRQRGGELNLPADLDGARLMWAFAGRESSFGRNSTPRHESIYCTGKYSTNQLVIALTKKFGHDAHCSFGPWQVLLVNIAAPAPERLKTDPNAGASAFIEFMNREILGRQHATTVAQMADAYNSGNFRDRLVPQAYMAGVLDYYTAGLPPASGAAAADLGVKNA